ncbi:ABC transporter substrate-binding protein [Dactylosporangium sp. CA-092794]|uniref:ABC transporter substrate-binding protein n=1 Tax=Dactylosporangium sp. CA-092794 TaxID=3239929 RepID=UPI003D8F5B76
MATGVPVTIGAMTQSIGSSGLPDPKAGLDAAVWYVNNELGGIGGHPVKIDLCQDDLTPATAVACGNQFVSNHDPVVLDTYDHGIAAAVPALRAAKIPYVGELAGDPAIETEAGGFFWTGPLVISVADLMPIMQADNVKRAGFVGPDLTAVHTYFDKAVNPMAKRIGITIDVTYIDPATTSFDSVATTLQKASPDLIGNVGLTEDQVTSLISSLRTQGWTKPLFGSSASKFVHDLPGEQYKGVTIAPRTWLPAAEQWAPATTKQQLADFENALTQSGHKGMDSDKSIYAFASLVNLVQILNAQKVTDVTSANIVAAIEATANMPSFLGPTLTCNGTIFPRYPTACTNEGIYFTVQSDGSFKPGVSDGFAPLDLKTLFGS